MPQTLPLVAFNRGIGVGVVYAGLLLVPLLLSAQALGLHPDEWHLLLRVALPIVGFATGAVVGFSAMEPGGTQTPWPVRLLHAAVGSVWVADILLIVNLLHRWEIADNAILVIGLFVAGAFGGSTFGLPFLSWAGGLAVFGRHPFTWLNAKTESLGDDPRFIVRVLLHTLVFIVLFMATLTLLAIVLSIIAIAITFWIISLFLNKDPEARRIPSFSLRRDERIREEDGRIVRSGLLFDTETNRRKMPDGTIVEEGFLVNKDTGIRIDGEGRVMKKGLLFEEATGIRLKDEGDGTRQVVREGFFGDKDTCMRIGKDGQARRAGFFQDQDTGLEIAANGEVSEIHTDLSDRGYLKEAGADRRLMEERLLFDRDTKVRIGPDGQARREGILFDKDIDLDFDENGQVKERKR